MVLNSMLSEKFIIKIANIDDFFKLLQKYNTSNYYNLSDEFTSYSKKFSK